MPDFQPCWIIITFALSIVACGPDAVSMSTELASASSDPCRDLRQVPSEVPVDGRNSFIEIVRRRCAEAQCNAYSVAVRTGVGRDVETAARALRDPEVAPGLPAGATACDTADEVIALVDGLQRARSAAVARPPQWDQASYALGTLPQLPPEVRNLFVQQSEIDDLYRRCFDDARADAVAAGSSGRWANVSPAAQRAVQCAERLPPSARPSTDEVRELEQRAGDILARQAARSAVCDILSQARSAESADDVMRRLDDLFAQLASVSADLVSASERSRLRSARAAAQREANRCERQDAMGLICEDRCLDVADYRPDSWLDRCMEFCRVRAPNCSDQRAARVARGRPPSNVDVPTLRYCEDNRNEENQQGETRRERSVPRAAPPRQRRVGLDSFE